MDTAAKEITTLLNDWTDNENKTKKCFTRLRERLETKDGVCFKCVARPGISYSLRAAHNNQHDRGLFAMVDVIDDDPADRWLSVCFYGDMISDPKELGDYVPEGLLGEDATCFDVYQWDDELLPYIEARLDEACKAAANGEY